MDISQYLQYLTVDDILSYFPRAYDTEAIGSEISAEALVKLNELAKDDNFSSTKLRRIWVHAIREMFFQEFQKIFIFKPTKKFESTNGIKSAITSSLNELKTEIITMAPKIYVSKIEDKPLRFTAAICLEEVKDFDEFLTVDIKDLLILTIFPKIGVSTLLSSCTKLEQKVVLKLLMLIFKDVKELRLNSLLLRKYSVSEPIQKLTISTPPDIAGFKGINMMQFMGENVMEGLTGLKRRHDADVEKITRVGPYTEIISNNLHLLIGTGIKILKYDGIDPLLQISKK